MFTKKIDRVNLLIQWWWPVWVLYALVLMGLLFHSVNEVRLLAVFLGVLWLVQTWAFAWFPISRYPYFLRPGAWLVWCAIPCLAVHLLGCPLDLDDQYTWGNLRAIIRWIIIYLGPWA